jgi:RNA polymerase sigma-70 factor (ECF subfamily)
MEPLVIDRTQPSPSSLATAVVPFPVAINSERPNLSTVFASEESGLLRYAIGLVGRRTIAEEIVQESFLRLHQGWDAVENPRAWLYRTVRNLALNHLRDRPNESELHEETAPAEGSLPPEQLGRDEAIGTVRLLLAEMPAEDRDLVRLKYLEGLKYEEISRRTGLSVGNVGYRLHHLLKALAGSLRRAGIDGSQG